MLLSYSRIKSFLQNGALFLISLSISFVAAEAGYRIYLHKVVTDQLVQSVEAHLNPAKGLDVFDPEIGFHYEPNSTWANFAFFRDEFHINQFGFMGNDLDPSPYTEAKPPNEYRIAVLGDSFTLAAQGYVRWTDLLQDYLNHSAAWRARVGGKFTRVLNFGLDGTGLVQWPAVYRFRASRFAPDLVLVSFITGDIRRQFVYRGDPGGVAGAGHASIRKFVEDKLVDRLPWYGLHSEIIAAVGGLFTNTDRRLTAAAAYDTYTSIRDRPTAIRENISALAQIRCMNSNLIIFQHPMHDELMVREDIPARYPSDVGNPPIVVGLETELLAAAKQRGIDIVQLAKINPLPPDRSRATWLYNFPIDEHNSDYGVVLYAQWIFRYLVSRSEVGATTSASPSCKGLD
ncbi:MAG TPA: SGNH/GDSL hydrolase family protein [Pseudolabrys sp.]|jgi:hypothetical protein